MSSSTLPLHRPPVGTPRPDGPSPARPAPAVGPATDTQVAGRYRYDRSSGDWWWSPEMFTVHGLPPHAAVPCTELLLQQLHPDDRTRVLEAITTACSVGRPFSLETRVRRGDAERAVVLMGEPDLDPAGGVRGVEGLCVDITDGRPAMADQVRALQTEVTQMRAAMASRAAIEQAKGILMLLTCCGDQVAFDLLAHISSHTHRKVRDVAVSITESAAGHTRLPDDVREILRDACPPSQPLR
jgi:hypothetical protein